MIRKLRKVGNSNALILDKTLMELIGVREGEEVEVHVSGGTLIVTARSERADQINAHLNEIIRERHELLKRLAE